MFRLARNQGFDSRILKTANATRAAVTDEIRDAAKSLRSGDFFFLTYAGHGGQLKDVGGDEQDDGKYET
jgi:hypothetical protein